VRFGKQLFARDQGNYGDYRTRTTLAKKVTGDCSCPSDWWPCKHVHALRETWKISPQSFFDLDQFLAELFDQPKAKLVEAIGQIVRKSPECRQVLGVRGFEDEDEDENENENEEEYWGYR